jgi:hypothetical protein
MKKEEKKRSNLLYFEYLDEDNRLQNEHKVEIQVILMMDHYRLYWMEYVLTKDEKILLDFHRLDVLTLHPETKSGNFFLIRKSK